MTLSGTLFFGNRQFRLQEVDSTNTFALDLLKMNAVHEGAVIIAEKQTSGRGQRGNSWVAEAGKNLTVSYVLKPSFLSPAAQFDLNRFVSLAVTDVLNELLPGFTICIKWPNDILISGKKICGILIENTISGRQISGSVAGIGLNINQEFFGENAINAVSLKMISGKEFDRESILQRLHHAMEARYIQLRSGNTEQLRTQYENKLFRKGEPTQFSDGHHEFTGTPEYVTPEGLLVVTVNGAIRFFAFKEIVWLKQD
ncbi:MAG: biotin--[acetyl-CoA-carboxylase] ligase [Bacteroidia bacterium]